MSKNLYISMVCGVSKRVSTALTLLTRSAWMGTEKGAILLDNSKREYLDESVGEYIFGNVLESDIRDAIYSRDIRILDACRLMCGKKIIGIDLFDPKRLWKTANSLEFYLEDEKGKRFSVTICSQSEDGIHYPNFQAYTKKIKKEYKFEMED